MERYRILPHTADGKFQAFGATVEEAFANAALAMASLMWDWEKVPARLRHQIRLDGRDKAQLLVKLLNEIIYLFETRRFMLARVEGLRLRSSPEGLRLEAALAGDRLSDESRLHGVVKAATYHELTIEEGDGVTVQVVVDI